MAGRGFRRSDGSFKGSAVAPLGVNGNPLAVVTRVGAQGAKARLTSQRADILAHGRQPSLLVLGRTNLPYLDEYDAFAWRYCGFRNFGLDSETLRE